MSKVLLLHGGWDGHQPDRIARLFASELHNHGLEAQLEASLDILADEKTLRSFSLIFPCWTMGRLSDEQAKGLTGAIRSGVGLGGIHGGMGDAFRGCTDYEWMVGGHFVGHPHVGSYTVNLTGVRSPITEGAPGSWDYDSEQYYMLVDPVIEVLAETTYTHEGRTCTMPVVWTKHWGKGRVFYNALGHRPEEFETHPAVKTLTTRGLLWAAGLL